MFEKSRLILTAFAFAATLALGGKLESFPLQNLFQQVLWLLTLVVWLPECRFGFATRRGMYATIIGLSGIALMFLQLIPLPVSIWHQFPGRQFVKDALELSGQSQTAMPISLEPASTKAAIVNAACGLAFFFAGQKMQQKNQIYFFAIVLAFGVLSVLLGLAQVFLGPTSGLYPYKTLGTHEAQGTFINRNHFAALLYCTIPALFALAVSAIAQRRAHIVVVALFCFLYLAMLIAGIAASQSRMGMILAMVAVLASAILAKGLAAFMGNQNKGTTTKFGLVGLVTSLILFGQFGLASILRFASTDAAEDGRAKIFEKSIESARDFFPLGSGFGTFVPVYQLTERPQDMIEGVYINRAHNDWIELFLTGGAPMAIIMVTFLIWFLASTISVWKNVGFHSNDLVAKASTIIVFLLMLHSLVDYPATEPALKALLCLCLGFMCAARLPLRSHAPKTRNAEPASIPNNEQPRRSPPRLNPRPTAT